MNIEFILLSEENKDKWNEFCLKSNDAWFRHTTYFMDYIKNCRWENKADNLSFFISLNGEIIAIAPLMIQPIYNRWEFKEFAMYDTNIPSPAFCETKQNINKKDITKSIFEYINSLAIDNNVAYSRFFVDPLTDKILHPIEHYFSFSSFGYTDYPISSNILLIERDEESILREMRKGHKADVKYAMKMGYFVDIYDSTNITEETLLLFKEMHKQDAGRQTRPDESWTDMLQWIKNGYAILFLEKIPSTDQYVDGALVIIYNNKAYYGSSATAPGFEGIRAIGQFIQWEIIKELKRKKIDYYDIGWNFSQGFSQEIASAKETYISKYKAGFGGQPYPLYRGEKVYNKEYFIDLYNYKVNRFSEIKFS
jgi:hypothetical protein